MPRRISLPTPSQFLLLPIHMQWRALQRALDNLSTVLPNFEWNYTSVENCALGVATELWGWEGRRELDRDPASNSIFYAASKVPGNPSLLDIEPHHVAQAIRHHQLSINPARRTRPARRMESSHA